MAITRIGNIASTIPDDSIQNVKFSNIVQSKNIIINGDMSIAQRGTSVSGITSGSTYILDRFVTAPANAGTWTTSQDTDVPTGQGFAKSFKLDCTTANASLSAGSFMTVQQRFEGQNLQYLKKGTANAESLTLSFWVKSNKTGTYIAELYDNDNTRQISKSYTIDSANTWEKKTITYVGDTTGAFDNDNALSLYCTFWLGAGSSYTSGTLNTDWNSATTANRVVGQVNLADSTANEWYITGVQLEAGTTASDFEFLPVDVNLQRCQRYYEVVRIPTSTSLFVSYTYGSNQFNYWQFKTQKRARPTISLGSSASANGGTINFYPGFDTCQLYRVSGAFYVSGSADVIGLIAQAEL